MSYNSHSFVPSEERNSYWGWALYGRKEFRYGVAGIPVLLAIAVRGALNGVLGIHAPYLPAVLGVTIAALVGGKGPGVAATILSALGAAYFFLEPFHSIAIRDPQATAGLALFVATGFIISLLIGHLREALLSSSRAEAALRESEAQFRTLANAIPQLCWMANGDGWIFWYNERWYEYTGTTPEQMQGWGWQSVHDPEKLPNVLERWKDSIATGKPFDMVFPLRGKNGVFRPFLTRVMPVRNSDGKVVRWFGTNTDISEQQKTEEALRQSESRYSMLAEALPAIVFMASPLGQLEYVNRKWEEYTGIAFQPNESVAPRLVHPEDYDRSQQTRASSLQTGRSYDDELRLRRHDGVYRWFHSRVTPLLDEQGRILKWIGVSTDIEEQKQTEDRLRSSQKLEALGRLAGGVAHDFNNLLTVISGFNAMAMEELNDHPELLAHLQEVKGAAERAADLTRQLLAFSRRQVSQPKLLNLNNLVENIRNLLVRVIGEDIELISRLSAETVTIKADPIQVDQVIMNLAVNARDAMPGGGRLTLETANALVADEEARTLNIAGGHYVVLTVSDTGTGMDESTRSRLFEPFFTTKEQGKGTGLGLSIVYGVVSQSGGAIQVESEPGAGTTFRVYFPRSWETEEVDLATAATPSTPTGETILLIEDEETVRKLVTTMLRQRGFFVLEAATPGAAIRLAADYEGPIDVLLSDVLMPEMRGPQVSQRIREWRPNIAVIFMSGYSDRTFIDPSALQDAVYLQKPFTSEELRSKIRAALDRRLGGSRS